MPHRGLRGSGGERDAPRPACRDPKRAPAQPMAGRSLGHEGGVWTGRQSAFARDRLSRFRRFGRPVPADTAYRLPRALVSRSALDFVVNPSHHRLVNLDARRREDRQKPTNNHAERSLRGAVIYRKLPLGTQSHGWALISGWTEGSRASCGACLPRLFPASGLRVCFSSSTHCMCSRTERATKCSPLGPL